jgi:hypothetical protein
MCADDPRAAGELLSHAYRELRALAASKMAHGAPGQTLHAKELGISVATIERTWAFARAPGSSGRSGRAAILRLRVSQALVRGITRK